MFVLVNFFLSNRLIVLYYNINEVIQTQIDFFFFFFYK